MSLLTCLNEKPNSILIGVFSSIKVNKLEMFEKRKIHNKEPENAVK